MRDAQVLTRQQYDLAKLASASLPPDRRLCYLCDNIKSINDFTLTRLGVRGYRCTACDRAYRRRNEQKRQGRERNRSDRSRWPCMDSCGNTVAKRDTRCLACYTAQKQTSVRQTIKPYACIDNCGKMVRTPETRCAGCKRNHQLNISSLANQSNNAKRVFKALESGSSAGVMLIGTETWTLPYLCSDNGCDRPVLVKTKCYFHATGRKISLRILPQIVRKEDIGLLKASGL